jgi:hypothetical protein
VCGKEFFMAKVNSKETWENSSKGKVYVLRYDSRGELIHEIVRAGGKVQLTPDERVINMERASTPDLCVFRNGVMSPVRLLDSTEDAEEIASNPNIISESDISDLFSSHWKTFETRVNEISNLGTLERILSLAEDEDSGATVRQVNVLRERIGSLRESV